VKTLYVHHRVALKGRRRTIRPGPLDDVASDSRIQVIDERPEIPGVARLA
jgi:hypothetical protein